MRSIFALITFLIAAPCLALGDKCTAYWPQWRGPDANGIAPCGNPPIQWSEDSNIRWKLAVPGKGHATPIIWKDLVFISTAVPLGDPIVEVEEEEEPSDESGRRRWMRGVKPDRVLQFKVMAIQRKNGEIRWERTLREIKPHEGTHTDATWASTSSITDGEHLYAYFGSQGIYCLDLEGNLKWEKDLGDMTIRAGFGEGSSPALHGNTLVLNWDHEGPSFIVALDKRTGEELWRNPRDERTSWSTPLIVAVDGRPQVIVNATNRIVAYDLESGDTVWENSGMTVNVIPTPVYAGGVVYLASGFRGAALQAIRLKGAKGNLAGTDAVLWSYDEDTPYVPSPLLYGNNLYFFKGNKGILTNFDVEKRRAPLQPPTPGKLRRDLRLAGRRRRPCLPGQPRRHGSSTQEGGRI